MLPWSSLTTMPSYPFFSNNSLTWLPSKSINLVLPSVKSATALTIALLMSPENLSLKALSPRVTLITNGFSAWTNKGMMLPFGANSLAYSGIDVLYIPSPSLPSSERLNTLKSELVAWYMTIGSPFLSVILLSPKKRLNAGVVGALRLALLTSETVPWYLTGTSWFRTTIIPILGTA